MSYSPGNSSTRQKPIRNGTLLILVLILFNQSIRLGNIKSVFFFLTLTLTCFNGLDNFYFILYYFFTLLDKLEKEEKVLLFILFMAITLCFIQRRGIQLLCHPDPLISSGTMIFSFIWAVTRDCLLQQNEKGNVTELGYLKRILPYRKFQLTFKKGLFRSWKGKNVLL